MKTQTASVNFHDNALTVITHATQQLVAMKPIAEAIGLDWDAQRKRIQRHPVLKSTAVMMTSVAQDGKLRELLCLPLTMLNGWLFGVDANRVRDEVRETLIMYQRECYQVLAAYWQQGEAVNPRPPAANLVGSVIGSTGLIVLDRVIDQKAQAIDKGMRRSFITTLKSRLRGRFNVQRTDLIPAEQLADACNFVAAYTLEGEYLGKEHSGIMTPDDLYRVYVLTVHFNALHEIFRRHQMYESLKNLGSRAGIEMIDHFKDGHHHAYMLREKYGQAMDDFQREHGLNHYRLNAE